MALSPYTVTIYTKQDNPYNVIPDAPIEIRERLANGTSGSLSIIYSDQEGLIPITQTGAKADSNGQFVFYAEAAQYNAVYESQTVPVDVGVTLGTLPSAIINNLSLPYVFDTEADYKSFGKAFPVGKVIKLLDRGADFTVITGTGSANGRNIIGSTTVSQSITIRKKNIIDLLTYGAVDGQDITEMTQLANDNLAADGGGTILVPRGSFKFTAQTVGNTFPAALYLSDKVKLFGVSAEASNIVMDNAQNVRFIVSDNLRGNPALDPGGTPSVQNRDIEIAQLTINGNRVNQSPANQKSNIALFNVLNAKVQGVRSINSAHHGIEYWKCEDSLINKNIVTDSAVTSIMVYKGNNKTLVTKNFCKGSGKDAGIGSGVTVDNESINCSVIDNILEDDGWYNIVISEGSNNCRVIGNFCKNAIAKASISLSEGQTGVDTYGIIVQGNNISNGNSHGIEVQGVRDCPVTGNTIIDNVSGIKVRDAVTQDTKRIIVSDNILHNIAASGIEVKPEGSGSSVFDITVDDNTVSSTDVHGIFVQGVSKVKVTNNFIRDPNSNNIIQDLDAGIKIRDVPDLDVRGNDVDGTFHQYGLLISNSGAGLSPRMNAKDNNFKNAVVADITKDTADLTSVYFGNRPDTLDFGASLGYRSNSNDPVTAGVVPIFIGEEFFKTSTADWYKSYGDSTSAQWKLIT